MSKVKYLYDNYIKRLCRNLRKNTLAMDEEDLMQYGRLQAEEARKRYNKDHPSGADEKTFVYRHLLFRYCDLVNRSLTRKSTEKNRIKARQRMRSENSIERFQAHETDYSDELLIGSNVASIHLTPDSTIQIKDTIEKLIHRDQDFATLWKEYNSMNDRLAELCTPNSNASPEYLMINRQMASIQNRLYSGIKKEFVESGIDF